MNELRVAQEKLTAAVAENEGLNRKLSDRDVAAAALKNELRMARGKTERTEQDLLLVRQASTFNMNEFIIHTNQSNVALLAESTKDRKRLQEENQRLLEENRKLRELSHRQTCAAFNMD